MGFCMWLLYLQDKGKREAERAQTPEPDLQSHLIVLVFSGVFVKRERAPTCQKYKYLRSIKKRVLSL